MGGPGTRKAAWLQLLNFAVVCLVLLSGAAAGQDGKTKQQQKRSRPANLWDASQSFEMRVYISSSPEFKTEDWVSQDKDFAGGKYAYTPEGPLSWDIKNDTESDENVEIPPIPEVGYDLESIDENGQILVAKLTDLEYQTPFEEYIHLRLKLNDGAQKNGTLYAHVVSSKTNHEIHPHNSGWKSTNAQILTSPLVRYKHLRSGPKLKNLLSGAANKTMENGTIVEQTPEEEEDYNPILSHWHNNLTIAYVEDPNQNTLPQLSPTMRKNLTWNRTAGGYMPLVWRNEFWTFKEDMKPINSTVLEVDLYICAYHLSIWHWQMMVSMDESFGLHHEWGTMNEDEPEEFKRMLLDTDPWLLGITFVVSILHTIFDFLAFKNDIQYWRKRKTVKGISVRTLFTNLGMQVIIFLYLLDNDTSYLILMSNFVGLFIDFWKAGKAANISLDYQNKYFGIIPAVRVEDHASYAKSKTKEFDDLAFSYLSYALYPIVVIYSVYSLMYNEHKSWYSFILNTVVGIIYMFGFIMMTPQLFINYKLKSVAHLPWRMLTYRALNTFIDDLFAFIIKMPLLHRLACFRDDLIFFIYLYQRYIYPVDPNRRFDEDDGTQEPSEASEGKPLLQNGEKQPAESKKDK
eukprot:Clim_evm41s246 gene=Clim_evmTU41s246